MMESQVDRELLEKIADLSRRGKEYQRVKHFVIIPPVKVCQKVSYWV